MITSFQELCIACAKLKEQYECERGTWRQQEQIDFTQSTPTATKISFLPKPDKPVFELTHEEICHLRYDNAAFWLFNSKNSETDWIGTELYGVKLKQSKGITQ